MCDGHRDLYQNLEQLSTRIVALEEENERDRQVWRDAYKKMKAIQDRHETEDLSRIGGEAVRFPHARQEE